MAKTRSPAPDVLCYLCSFSPFRLPFTAGGFPRGAGFFFMVSLIAFFSGYSHLILSFVTHLLLLNLMRVVKFPVVARNCGKAKHPVGYPAPSGHVRTLHALLAAHLPVPTSPRLLDPTASFLAGTSRPGIPASDAGR